MYVDYPADEENAYQFWIARANLSEMEGQSDEIPCQITKIEARNLQQLEEKYLETVPGKTEWNHIYTIFLGSGIAANKTACTHLLKEWERNFRPESIEKIDERYVEAVQNREKVEFQLDTLLWGTEDEKEAVIHDLGKGVEDIERRVREYRRNQGTVNHNRQRSYEAVH